MTNLNIDKGIKDGLVSKMSAAIAAGETEQFSVALAEYSEHILQAVAKDAKELKGVQDHAILAQRGIRQLTNKEHTYFSAVRDAMRTENPQMALSNINIILPETEIDAIFEDIQKQHPLLDAIDFMNTGAVVKILASTTTGVATWGELTATISAELGGAFSEVDLTLAKLSAFIPVANAMLDLGPEYLEKWIRTVMVEAIAVGLEAAIIDGDGKGKPIGMTRALSGATDGVYPRKTAVEVNSLDPVSFGTIANTLSQGPNSKRRAVPEILMVVNPADYYTKVFPATTIRTTDGGYNTNVFPYPTKVVVSDAVPANHAVFGLAKQYIAPVGVGTKGGKLEYDDSVKFLEDARVYRIKVYANGKPKDANAFVYANITNLVPTVLDVKVVNAEEFPVA